MAEISRMYIVTQLLTIFALVAVIELGLLPSLLAGLLIYQLVEFGAKQLSRAGVIPTTGKIILLVLLSLLVVSGLTFGSVILVSSFTNGPESVTALLQKMADVVEKGRSHLPLWGQEYLPSNIGEWQNAASEWLRENARILGGLGRDAGIFVLHLIVGMIIGGMVALSPLKDGDVRAPLAKALTQRVEFLGKAFRRIVFSQVRISALNTFLTGVFLAGVLPAMGHPLPLTKIMIAVTFIVGLLPIVGNLISNTVIFLIALGVSPLAAVGALSYLVIIHKLEYFINAHIIGSQIKARAWEILLAMLVMEAAFGMSGLVAAAIYYAYIKDELAAQRLI